MNNNRRVTLPIFNQFCIVTMSVVCKWTMSTLSPSYLHFLLLSHFCLFSKVHLSTNVPSVNFWHTFVKTDHASTFFYPWSQAVRLSQVHYGCWSSYLFFFSKREHHSSFSLFSSHVVLHRQQGLLKAYFASSELAF